MAKNIITEAEPYRVFSSEDHPGVDVYLHKVSPENFESLNDFLAPDDFDHVFYFTEGSQIHAKFFNKAGSIQFCGSGAFAVCKKNDSGKNLELLCNNQSYHYSQNQLSLSAIDTSRFFSSTLKQEIDKCGSYFFLELENKEAVQNFKLSSSISNGLSKEDCGGFCIFHYDKESLGFVRYFSPWHGRDEDYVTGSIHSMLTPIVNNRYAIDQQSWVQLSSQPGSITTSVDKNTVFISEDSKGCL